MAKQLDPNASPQQPPANQPLILVRGKPTVYQYPTPNLADRVFKIRKDPRATGYKIPNPGDPYEGKAEYAAILKDFVFATAKPTEDNQVDWFYVNERLNQDAYNFVIEFPYADKNYPRFIRTYVVLRTSTLAADEPQADTTDAVFPELVLTDHKISRIDDPVFDAVFVTVQRIFERMPGPVITSYGTNQFQQLTVTREQEVIKSPSPQLSALIESASQERVTKAKAKNKVTSIPRVFPKTMANKSIPSIIREEYMGGFTENQSSQRVAGTVETPTLGAGEITKTETQETEFVKEVLLHNQDLPQTRANQETTEEFGGEVLDENIDIAESGLVIEQGYGVTDSKLRNLGPFGQIKITKKLPDGIVWPVLHEEKILTAGIYAGIRILIDKQYVPAGTTNPGGYTDMVPRDKWRTLQITSRIDLNSLPAPFVYAGTHPLSLPPTLLGIQGIYADRGGSSQAVTNDGLDGEGVSVAVESGPLGTISHSFVEGFHGNAVAQITRIFTPIPPTRSGNSIIINGVAYTPYQWNPVQGTATMFSIYTKFAGSQAGDANGTARSSSSSNNGQNRVQTVSLRSALTGNFIAHGPTNTTFTGAPNIAGATTTDGHYHIEMFQPGNQAYMVVDVPLSSPAALPASGSMILAAVDVTEWRFGIWVIHLIEAVIP